MGVTSSGWNSLPDAPWAAGAVIPLASRPELGGLSRGQELAKGVAGQPMVRPPLAGPRPGTARTSPLGRRSRRPNKARGPTVSGTLHGEPATGFMLEPYHAVAA